uniref:Uncharacterized protein n=1 Tax=Arundo donax TaxID=35708 RepID=A0A0A9A3B8_ARUDO
MLRRVRYLALCSVVFSLLLLINIFHGLNLEPPMTLFFLHSNLMPIY